MGPERYAAVLKAVDAEGLGSPPPAPEVDPIQAAEARAVAALLGAGVELDVALQRARAEGNRLRAERGDAPVPLTMPTAAPRRPSFQAPEPEGDGRVVIQAIPKRWRSHRLETVGHWVKRPEAVAETRAALQDLLAGDALAVTFLGRSMAGKTSLAAALVAAMDQAELEGDDRARRLLRDFLWIDALTLSRARASFKLGDGEAPLVERARRASLVVVDEVGSETITGSDEILDVILHRWEGERPLIATTGQPPGKIRDRYGEGVLTRMTKQAQSRAIACSEPPKNPQQELPLAGGQPR